MNNAKHRYQVTNLTSGVDLGIYSASDKSSCLDAVGRDAGYNDYAEACAAICFEQSSLRVTIEACPRCGEDTVLACDDASDASTEYGLCKDCETHHGCGDTRKMS
jgi:predicted RNA-binding Zn-ribbon protein involved in translation (DUF1610 family)